MMLANVIFPAFAAPYLSYLFVPATLAAILIEVIIFKFRISQLPWFRSFWNTFLANLVSWFFGVTSSFILPSGLVPKMTKSGFSIVSQGPNFMRLVWMGFAVAYLLSIFIEFVVWRRLLREKAPSDLLSTTILAHTASYLALLLILFYGLPAY